MNGSEAFNRSWAAYKVGFNDSKGNYWLGNELLSQLTHNGSYKLRFELQLRNLSWYWAEYRTFIVLSETYNYRLLVSGYSGNIGDALSYHNAMMFTTYDRDNDPWNHSTNNYNCAVWIGGGFWWKNCYSCAVNSVYNRFKWKQPHIRTQFRRYSQLHYTSYYLQTSRMWLTC